MRPTYETGSDQTKERRVAESLARLWKCEPRKMPRFFKCDFALTQGRTIKCLLEIKCRGVPSTQYQTLILSLDKWTGLQLYAKHKPTVLAAAFNDCVKWINVDEAQYEVAIGGREDRGDWQDVEPVIHIPIQRMKVAYQCSPTI